MFCSVAFISEFIPADMALKRPFASVSPIMILQFTSRLKILLAYITNKSTLPRMKFNVSFEKVWPIKASSATWELTKKLLRTKISKITLLAFGCVQFRPDTARAGEIGVPVRWRVESLLHRSRHLIVGHYVIQGQRYRVCGETRSAT